MMTALRGELRALLDAAETRRPPALRRSSRPDFLFAADLPLAADVAAADFFCRQAEAAGWRFRIENGWIFLDHPVLPEPAGPVTAPGETGCVLSVLRRHPGESDPDPEAMRAILKAAEQSPDVLEKVCTELHRALAVRLRNHEPMPRLLYDCLAGEALSIGYGRREDEEEC